MQSTRLVIAKTDIYQEIPTETDTTYDYLYKASRFTSNRVLVVPQGTQGEVISEGVYDKNYYYGVIWKNGKVCLAWDQQLDFIDNTENLVAC
jgi:hypothetical protein